MSLNTHYKKIKFSDHLRSLLSRYYDLQDDQTSEITALKYRIDGYVQAGLIMDVLDNVDIQALIDKVHMDKFGMTRNQRRAEKKLSSKKEEIKDWSIYDPPTIERYKNSS